jgi:hypothetical protein
VVAKLLSKLRQLSCHCDFPIGLNEVPFCATRICSSTLIRRDLYIFMKLVWLWCIKELISNVSYTCFYNSYSLPTHMVFIYGILSGYSYTVTITWYSLSGTNTIFYVQDTCTKMNIIEGREGRGDTEQNCDPLHPYLQLRRAR